MGPFGGDSEAISNGKPISSGRSFRSEGHSEWKVISNDPCELTYPMVPAGHGGEAPRAEGGRGGGKPFPFQEFLTRPRVGRSFENRFSPSRGSIRQNVLKVTSRTVRRHSACSL